MKYKLAYELMAIAATVVLTILLLIPIYNSTINYSFLYVNATFIFLFLTFTRYIFFIKYSPFSHNAIIKLIYIFLTIPIVAILLDAFGGFQAFCDEIGLQEFVKHLHAEKQSSILAYIKNQMLFFGAGSIVASIVLAFRMLISIWRVRNSNSV